MNTEADQGKMEPWSCILYNYLLLGCAYLWMKDDVSDVRLSRKSYQVLLVKKGVKGIQGKKKWREDTRVQRQGREFLGLRTMQLTSSLDFIGDAGFSFMWGVAN